MKGPDKTSAQEKSELSIELKTESIERGREQIHKQTNTLLPEENISWVTSAGYLHT